MMDSFFRENPSHSPFCTEINTRCICWICSTSILPCTSAPTATITSSAATSCPCFAASRLHKFRRAGWVRWCHQALFRPSFLSYSIKTCCIVTPSSSAAPATSSPKYSAHCEIPNFSSICAPDEECAWSMVRASREVMGVLCLIYIF